MTIVVVTCITIALGGLIGAMGIAAALHSSREPGKPSPRQPE